MLAQDLEAGSMREFHPDYQARVVVGPRTPPALDISALNPTHAGVGRI